LGLKPVFASTDSDAYVDLFDGATTIEDALNKQPEAARPHLLELTRELLRHGIVTTDATFDERVLRSLKSTLPKPTPQVVYFVMTNACNFACKYCFMIDNTKSATAKPFSFMSPATAVRSVDFVVEQLTKSASSEDIQFNFYGGEPLMNADAMEAILAHTRARVADGGLKKMPAFNMVTNGGLMNDRIARILKEYGVSIGFSLDGGPAITDSGRKAKDGTSPFDHVVNAIECCHRNHLPFGFSVTLTQEAVDKIDDVVDTIISLGPTAVGFNILFSGASNPSTDAYYNQAAEAILRSFDRLAEAGIPEDRVLRKIKAFAAHRFYPFDCGAVGAQQLVIGPNGEVGICHGFLEQHHYFPTDILDESFSMASDASFLEWSGRTPINMPECRTCMALGICGGGCAMNAANGEGTIWDLDVRFCIHAKMTLEWMIWRLFNNARHEKRYSEAEI
jgi:uncharacterized protein